MRKSLSAFVVILLGATFAGAQDYPIKMSQPFKVDQRYRYSATVQDSSQNTMTAQAKTLRSQKDELKAELESVVTVLEVDATGRAIKESHIIVSLVKFKGAVREPVLTQGSRVTAWRKDAEEVFEVGDKPAAADVAKVLKAVISISEGGSTDDEVFGTSERKKVGDSWSINEEPAREDFKKKAVANSMELQKISGRTTLQKVTGEGEDAILHLASTMTADLTPAGGPFSSGTATMTMTASGVFPPNLATGTKEETMTVTMSMKASGKPDPNGPVVQLNVSGRSTRTAKIKLMK